MAKRRKQEKKPWPIWKLVLTDIVVFAIALNVFALFHHVLPRAEEAVGQVSQRVRSVQQTVEPTMVSLSPEPTPFATPTPEVTVQPVVEATATPEPTPEPTHEPTPTPEPTPDPVGYFGTKFADKFTNGEVIQDENSYRSANVNVTFTNVREKGANIHIADIYIRDIACLQAVFAKDTFGRGYAEWPWDVAERKNPVVGVNGDFYGTRDSGVVIRNGVLYREDPRITRDVGVIYWDGTMECFSPKEFDTQHEMERGAYQAWNFGPMLLDEDGKAMEKFNSKVNPANPRAALGYFEPGHYCMVAVDGGSYASAGLSLRNLSALMEYLGCSAAYNLDGGGTAVMMRGTEIYSDPEGKGRQCSDFVMVMDEIAESFEEVERG